LHKASQSCKHNYMQLYDIDWPLGWVQCRV
jgi:hypothetical protein